MNKNWYDILWDPSSSHRFYLVKPAYCLNQFLFHFHSISYSNNFFFFNQVCSEKTLHLSEEHALINKIYFDTSSLEKLT